MIYKAKERLQRAARESVSRGKGGQAMLAYANHLNNVNYNNIQRPGSGVPGSNGDMNNYNYQNVVGGVNQTQAQKRRK